MKLADTEPGTTVRTPAGTEAVVVKHAEMGTDVLRQGRLTSWSGATEVEVVQEGTIQIRRAK